MTPPTGFDAERWWAELRAASSQMQQSPGIFGNRAEHRYSIAYHKLAKAGLVWRLKEKYR